MTLSKKIFIGSTAALAVLLIFWGIYSFSFKKTSVPQPAPADETTEPVAEEPKDSKKIIAISEEAVLAPVLTPEKTAIKYYSKIDGKVYQVSLDGSNKKTINTKELSELVSVAWSPDTSKVITHFENGGKNKFYYYDYAKGQGVQLKDNLDTVSWQSNAKILYKYFDPKTKERTLNISDPDGSNWNKITDLNFRNLSLAPIPKTGLISFWNSPDAFSPTTFQSTPLIGGEKKTLFSEKFGADYLWSPDGNFVLISSSPDKASSKVQLATANDRGGEYRNLSIPTFISKAVWSRDNKTVYYALPGNIPANSILPNDYLEKKFVSVDTFWKVNTVTGEKTRTADLDKIGGQYDATNLFLNSDESLLFFINRTDGKLYRLEL
jgi:hypothetical protein